MKGIFMDTQNNIILFGFFVMIIFLSFLISINFLFITAPPNPNGLKIYP